MLLLDDLADQTQLPVYLMPALPRWQQEFSSIKLGSLRIGEKINIMKKTVGSFIALNRNLIIALAVVLGVAASGIIAWQASAMNGARDNTKISAGAPGKDLKDPSSGVGPAGSAVNQQAAEQRTQDTPHGIYRGVTTAVRFDISPPLRTLQGTPARESREREEFEERSSGLEGPLGPQDIDQIVQTALGDSPNAMPTPSVSFDSTISCGGCQPPDPVGDVGPNHYVAMGNLQFQIFNKSGVSLMGPTNTNALWAGFGGNCQTANSGDPVVIYDQFDDRWILTQFTATSAPFLNCVAISTTPDPTGTYFRYAFQTGTTGANFPDYPKYGMWGDALYFSTREFLGSGGPFQGVGAYAVNRAQLVAGNPAAQVIQFLATPASAGGMFNVGDGLLPTDVDGAALPPAGAPNYFLGTMDQGATYGAPQDAITLWKFHVDFATPGNSTFTLANTIPIANFDTQPAFCSGRSCVPQPATSNKVDHLGYRQRPTHRAAYRNFGSHESIVTNQSVEASTTMSGIRWWEIRSPNSSPTIFQEGTYAPGVTDGIHRWMGSIAMDANGNMALGYSASDATTTRPSVSYTGRLVGDPLGTMPQGEASIIDGTGSQTSGQRWGDYSSMNIDSTDDCTFWYVNEYVPTTSWRMRIGAFKFPTCTTGPTPTATATATGTPSPTATSTATATATPTATPGPCDENFDGVTAPALPSGWATTASGVESPWVTTTAMSSSPPNSAFAPDPNNVGDTELVSTPILISGGGGSFSFQNNYNTESTFDGMVLEISVNGGAYQDILAAGGSFVTGGYNATISVNFMSPIAGRMAWSGNSGGFTTTTVNLPASANGQSIQLKWRMASDSSIAATGVWIDSISGLPCATAEHRHQQERRRQLQLQHRRQQVRRAVHLDS